MNVRDIGGKGGFPPSDGRREALEEFRVEAHPLRYQGYDIDPAFLWRIPVVTFVWPPDIIKAPDKKW